MSLLIEFPIEYWLFMCAMKNIQIGTRLADCFHRLKTYSIWDWVGGAGNVPVRPMRPGRAVSPCLVLAGKKMTQSVSTAN